jgi:ADP-heptose:LPS heptosyltransferase
VDLSECVGERIPDVRRIAVLRANALGDFIVTLPALDALRRAYPDAEIVLLGTPLHAELLAGRPGPVDRVVVVPLSRGIRDPLPPAAEDPAELEAFFSRMRAERYDLAVQLHGGGRWSNGFLLRLGAGTTAGLRAADAPPLDRWIPYALYQHEVLRMLEVVALVGAHPVTIRPAVPVTATDRAEADAALGADSRPLVALHPGAVDPRRRWPVERFAAVGDALAAVGARIVITGSRAERSIGEALAAQMRHPARCLCGDLGLSGLVGVLERCALVVANDTGPRHLAEAVGTATVSMYWCGNLVNVGPLARRRHRAHVSWRMACPVCGASAMGDAYPARGAGSGCGHRDSYVTDVPVDEVLPDALDLFGSESARRRDDGVVPARAVTPS